MCKRRIYLMRCDRRYKVGVSKDIQRRLRELDNRPYPVVLMAFSEPIDNAFEVEREVHDWLEFYRVSGEWFEIPDDVIGVVTSFIETLTDDIYETVAM